MLVESRVAGCALRAECGERNARRAASALAAFQGVAEAGTALAPGVGMRFGWSLLRLAEDGDVLRATEPDFAAWPEQRWLPAIDVTLDIQAAQIELLTRAGVDGEDAWFDQVLLAAAGALDEPRTFLRRTASLAHEDSGWLLGALDDPEALARGERLEPVRIAELVQGRPGLVTALALPRDFVAVFSGDEIEQVLDVSGRPLLPPAS